MKRRRISSWRRRNITIRRSRVIIIAIVLIPQTIIQNDNCMRFASPAEAVWRPEASRERKTRTKGRGPKTLLQRWFLLSVWFLQRKKGRAWSVLPPGFHAGWVQPHVIVFPRRPVAELYLYSFCLAVTDLIGTCTASCPPPPVPW